MGGETRRDKASSQSEALESNSFLEKKWTREGQNGKKIGKYFCASAMAGDGGSN